MAVLGGMIGAAPLSLKRQPQSSEHDRAGGTQRHETAAPRAGMKKGAPEGAP